MCIRDRDSPYTQGPSTATNPDSPYTRAAELYSLFTTTKPPSPKSLHWFPTLALVSPWLQAYIHHDDDINMKVNDYDVWSCYLEVHKYSILINLSVFVSKEDTDQLN